MAVPGLPEGFYGPPSPEAFPVAPTADAGLPWYANVVPTFGYYGEPVSFFDKLACRLSLQGCSATGGPAGVGSLAGQVVSGVTRDVLTGAGLDPAATGDKLGKLAMAGVVLAGVLAFASLRH